MKKQIISGQNLRRSQFEHTNSWIIANKQKTSRKWYLSDITQKPSWRVWCQRGDPLCTQCISNFSLKPFPYHSFIAHFYSFSKSIAWQKIISDGLQNLFFSGFQIMFFLKFRICRLAVILMRSQWSCCWVNIPREKQHS